MWLAALLGEAVMDVPSMFEPVWLARDVGASQSMVAVHAGVELVVALVGLALPDRLLSRFDARTILTAACVSSLLAYPVWLLVPGVAAKLVLIVPLTLAVTPIWPVVRARALGAVAGRGGMVMAIASLYGALPLAALFGWLAGRLGFTPVMLVAHTAATLVILATVRRSARPAR